MSLYYQWNISFNFIGNATSIPILDITNRLSTSTYSWNKPTVWIVRTEFFSFIRLNTSKKIIGSDTSKQIHYYINIYVINCEVFFNQRYMITFESLFMSVSWTKNNLSFRATLTLSWRRPLSYTNQFIDLQSKSMDWFLYDNGLRHERVNE